MLHLQGEREKVRGGGKEKELFLAQEAEKVKRLKERKRKPAEEEKDKYFIFFMIV